MSENELLETVQRDIKIEREKLADLLTVEKYLIEKRGLIPRGSLGLNGALHAPVAQVKMTQLEAARKVLEDMGRTMSTYEIADEIIKRGYCPGAPPRDKFKNNLFSIMRKRQELFRKAGRGLWALAKTKSRPDDGGNNHSPQQIATKGVGDAIKALVNQSPDREFTTAYFFDALKGQGVERVKIKWAVKRLVNDGFLEMLVQGTGRKLSVFKRKS